MANIDWANVSAVGCLILVVVWGITKGLPSLLANFKDELKAQRSDFREELKEHREQSRTLAESGHAAVNSLASSFDKLSVSLDQLKDSRDV